MRSRSLAGDQPGTADRSQTEDGQRHRGGGRGQLYIVGIGPAGRQHLSQRAARVLETVDAVAGYTTYIDLIRPLIAGKQIVSTAMKKEVDRVSAALDLALVGHMPAPWFPAGIRGSTPWPVWCWKCAANGPLPSGSAEKMQDVDRLIVEVVPGIPALCSGASL
jgi:hypothetical protein